MADEIKAGDIVQLKSGGPKMTVSKIGNTLGGTVPHAWCDWFESSKKVDSYFPLTSLKRAE